MKKEKTAQSEYKRFNYLLKQYLSEKLEGEFSIDSDVKESHVNVLFTGKSLRDGEKVIIKSNYFNRSVLYLFEKYKEVGMKEFPKLLSKVEEAYFSSIIIEHDDLRTLKKQHIPTYKTSKLILPNIMVNSFIEGRNLEDALRKFPQSKSVAESIARYLYKLHSSNVMHLSNLKSSSIRIFDGVALVQDPNFNEPIIINALGKSLGAALSAAIERGRVVVHGDFKPNNIIVSNDTALFIDPKLQIGIPHIDVGKFLMRSWVSAQITGEKNNIYMFCDQFFKAYVDMCSWYGREFLQVALALGVLELYQLTSKAARDDIEILGREMPEIYSLKTKIERLYDELIVKGRNWTLKKLFTLDYE